MFTTVLHNLKSPENAGIIVRTHVAFGGRRLVVIGREPWVFKKRAQAFSRRLEKVCDIVRLPTDDAFFDWCEKEGCTPVAVEIARGAALLPDFRFPAYPAIIVGNEGRGLPQEFLARCQHVVTIPQFGPVECLNAAVSCCMTIYELSRRRPCELRVNGGKFDIGHLQMGPRQDKSGQEPPRRPRNGREPVEVRLAAGHSPPNA